MQRVITVAGETYLVRLGIPEGDGDGTLIWPGPMSGLSDADDADYKRQLLDFSLAAVEKAKAVYAEDPALS